MGTINITLVIQVVSIIAASFGIIISLMRIGKISRFENLVMTLFVLFFSILLLSVEVYIIPVFRYFGFLLKSWGKACTYLILGFFVWGLGDLENVAAYVFWVLCGVYFVITFITTGIARPLLQKTGDINLSTSQSDYFIA